MLTLETYLELEQASEVRHELVGGLAYAMAGGSERHELLKDAILARVRPGARAAGCRAFSGRMLVVAAGSAYHPDVLVACGPAEHRLYEADAHLLVEVTSPSTSARDLREKLVAYATLASIELYLVVDPDLRSVRAARWPGGVLTWAVHGPGEAVPTPYGPLVVDEIYDEVDRDATT